MEVLCSRCTRTFVIANAGASDFVKCRHCGARHNILAQPEAQPTANAASAPNRHRAERHPPRTVARGKQPEAARMMSRQNADAARVRSRTPLMLMLIGVLTVAVSFGLYATRSWKREVARTQEVGKQALDRRQARANAAAAADRAAPAHFVSSKEADFQLRYVELSRDGEDRLTRVMDSTPEGALVAFCQHHDPDRVCTPIELASLDPPQIDARLGIFRDLSQSSTPRAVRIEFDRLLGKWVIGTGRQPIDSFELDPNTTGDDRLRVEP